MNASLFYLYVDEFQNFATQSFVQMLSESRKYKMFMMMAEQSTSQQKYQQMVDIILANVGTVICFRTDNRRLHLLSGRSYQYLVYGYMFGLTDSVDNAVSDVV
jgi:type IV secretory pathway VirB4 component